MTGAAKAYGTEVAKRLTQLQSEGTQILAQVSAIPGQIEEVSKKTGEVKEALIGVGKDINELIELPNIFKKMAAEIKTVDDVLKIDDKPLQEAADVSAIQKGLDSLHAGIDVIKPTSKEVQKVMTSFTAFVQQAPKRIEKAFSPSVGCIPTSFFMPETPKAATDLMEKVKDLEKFDLKPVVEALRNATARLEGVHLDSVSGPVTDYAKTAREELDQLNSVLGPIKQAQKAEGAVGAVLSMANQVGASFGGILAAGKQSRGAEDTEGYKFGDATRGVFSKFGADTNNK